MANIKKKKMSSIGVLLIFVAFAAAIIAAVVFIINNGSTTDELTISGLKNIGGIRCADDTQLSFLLGDYKPTTHKNTITAAFIDSQLSSITYAYEGTYNDEAEADHARDLIEANYNLTMSKEYGLDITDFTRNISVDKNTVHASITATDTKNLNSKTAPMFMLSNTQAFPSSLDDMETAYRNLGFLCTKEN